MNYQRIYDAIIERAKTRTLTGYKERHHIIPKCMGGTDSKTNLVDLTAREHFIVHKLLCEIYPDNKKLNDAVWCMINLVNKHHKRGYVVSNREYEYLRIRRSILIKQGIRDGSIKQYDLNDIPKEERILRSKKANKARQQTGYRHSVETVEKIRKGNLEKTISKDQKEQIAITVSAIWEDPNSVYNTIEYRDKLKTAQLRWHAENPKVNIELMEYCIKTETTSTAAQLRLYNKLATKTISRPTWDKWRKLIQ
jgi:hypothetical protein